ncbi:unnamed protein product [Durusdinium trenchii]|uniref:Uncharacterized protein n=1 Tax=Durusdinium trenchii TaxID=1381693 RepID=A0ABP0SUN7_9DINO
MGAVRSQLDSEGPSLRFRPGDLLRLRGTGPRWEGQELTAKVAAGQKCGCEKDIRWMFDPKSRVLKHRSIRELGFIDILEHSCFSLASFFLSLTSQDDFRSTSESLALSPQKMRLLQ